MSAFNVSVIVPVYNESAQVQALIQRLHVLQEDVQDIIVVDGGSSDNTAQKLSKHFTVISSEKGRANQMNAGAKHAKGTWLVFVHADTQFGVSHLKCLIEHASMHQWGRFNVRLDAQGLSFRTIEWFINQRSRITGIATGDQCIFVRKRFFDSLSGFANIPLMEDVDFSKRAKKASKPKCLSKKVVTSARRWQTYGVVHTVFLMWKLRWLFWLGTPADKLAKLYR